MDDYTRGAGERYGERFGDRHNPQISLHGQHQQHPKAYQAVRAATALTVGGSLLVLSGLILTGTVIALTVATPLLVIFSPVLVPAAITIFLIVGGFVASGGFGVGAVLVLAWIYTYMTGRKLVGSDQFEQARMKLAGKARDVRDKAHDQFGATYNTSTTTT